MATERLQDNRDMQAMVPMLDRSVELRHFVMLTEPNCELKARDHLRNVLRFDPYVPTEDYIGYQTIRTMFGNQRRKQIRTRPIFRGYLFLPLNLAWSFGPLYRCPGLRQNGHPFLMCNERPVILSDEDVHILKLIEFIAANPGTPALPYKVGSTVKVVDGPFIDWVGKVTKLDDEDRIEVLMDILGRKTKFHTSAAQLVVAD